jgi:hypothetical protein
MPSATSFQASSRFGWRVLHLEPTGWDRIAQVFQSVGLAQNDLPQFLNAELRLAVRLDEAAECGELQLQPAPVQVERIRRAPE